MKIKVLEKIDETPVYQDEFVLVAVAGFGDADGEETVILGRYGNDKAGKKNLKEMIRLAERMKNAFPQGMGGQDTFNHVPGYTELLEDIWVWDPFTDGHGSLDSYKVFYYDENHEKYAVEVTGE